MTTSVFEVGSFGIRKRVREEAGIEDGRVSGYVVAVAVDVNGSQQKQAFSFGSKIK